MAYETSINPSDRYARELEILQEERSWFLGVGIALTTLGIIALVAVGYTTLATVLVFGILLIVAGVLQVVAGIRSHSVGSFVLHLLVGVLYGIVGLLMLANPAIGMLSLTVLLVALFLTGGIVRIFSAFLTASTNRGWMLFNGIVDIAIGVLIWAGWPASALWAVGLLIGVELLTTGIMWTTLAVAARPRRRGATSRPAAHPG